MPDEKKQIIIRRTFNASNARLWEAFTTRADMLRWHSPAFMTTPEVDIDFRVGGKYAITMEYDQTGERVTVRGAYLEIKEPNMLRYTWKWDGQAEGTEIVVEFNPLSEDKTEVVLTQSGFSDRPSTDDIKHHRTHADHMGGWTTAFVKLERLLIIPT